MGRINKMNGFNYLLDTVFVKNFNEKNENLNKLEALLYKTNDLNLKAKISKEIKIKKCGLEGESKVYFELKNSLLPMLCLHDIRIKIDDKIAQIDFLIITNKFIYILETKHLVGDIRVNEFGDFIRIIKDSSGKIIREEGMYSPITQGQRHARLLEKLILDKNILNIPQFPIKSIAVLANPKTILDIKNPDVNNSICRCDKLVNFIESELMSPEYDLMLSDNKIMQIANDILKEDCPIVFDYESKYFKNNSTNIPDVNSNTSEEQKNLNAVNNESKVLNEEQSRTNNEDTVTDIDSLVTFSDAPVTNINFSSKKISYSNNDSLSNQKNTDNVKFSDTSTIKNIPKVKNSSDNIKLSKQYLLEELKRYRCNKSLETGLPLYDIFNNKEMDKILEANPSSIEELIEIEKLSFNIIVNYGNDIINILHPNNSNSNRFNPNSNDELKDKLKHYRETISKKENTPPYLIFTNNELDRVIKEKPLTIEKLSKIKGFERKVNKYGNDIISIVSSVI